MALIWQIYKALIQETRHFPWALCSPKIWPKLHFGSSPRLQHLPCTHTPIHLSTRWSIEVLSHGDRKRLKSHWTQSCDVRDAISSEVFSRMPGSDTKQGHGLLFTQRLLICARITDWKGVCVSSAPTARSWSPRRDVAVCDSQRKNHFTTSCCVTSGTDYALICQEDIETTCVYKKKKKTSNIALFP